MFWENWLWEQTLFCTIQSDQRNRLAKAFLRWLKPGGDENDPDPGVPQNAGQAEDAEASTGRDLRI